MYGACVDVADTIGNVVDAAGVGCVAGAAVIGTKIITQNTIKPT